MSKRQFWTAATVLVLLTTAAAVSAAENNGPISKSGMLQLPQKLAIALDGGWVFFNDCALGQPCPDGPFLFSSPTSACVSVTDAFVKSDVYSVSDSGQTLGSTSPGFPDDGTLESDPDAAFSDPEFSSGTFVVGPGSHSIDVIRTSSDLGGLAAAYIRADSPGTPVYCEESAEPPLAASLEFIILSLPSNGILLDAQGNEINAVPTTLSSPAVTFQPSEGYAGSDQFTYQIDDGNQLSNIATSYLTVQGTVCSDCVNVAVEILGAGEGTVKPSPDPQGTVFVCGEDCVLAFPLNTIVKLQARPKDGASEFVGWSGACASAGTNPVATLVLASTGTPTCGALFEPAQ